MEKQIEKAREFIEAKKAKGSKYLLPLDLQHFAGSKDKDEDEDQDEDEDEDLDDEDNDDEDSSDPSLEQMLKDNPALKKEFNKLFKDRFDKRLKGVDLKEAKRLLKEKSDKLDQDDQEDKDRKQKNKEDEISDKARKIEVKTKRLAVKEFAVDNNLNPKLLSRLIDLDKLELDDDGELDNDDLEELVDELTEEFPELFRKSKQADQDEDEDEEQDDKSKARSHKVGSKKKTNKPKDKDLREAGKNKALERAKRKGLIQ
jgi:hypothetical protein